MLHTARCELDNACLYSLRNPRLAAQCAAIALNAAIAARRPDLAYAANELLAINGGR